MIRNLRVLIPLLLFIMIALFLWQGLKLNPHRVPSPFINKKLPKFSASTLYQPNKIMTEHDFLGRVTLLNVFATWCIACHAEHPVLMDIYNNNKVVIVGLDYKDTAVAAKKWLARYGNPYQTVIFDPQGRVGLDMGVYGTPETFVIDRKGVVRYKYIGPISPIAWLEKLKPMVQQLQRERS